MIDLNEVRPNDAVHEVLAGQPAEGDEVKATEPGPATAEPKGAGAEPGETGQLTNELMALKRKCLSLAAERELAMALSSEALIPGVTDQLVKLLKDRVVAEEMADQGFRVRSRDGRPLGEAVKEWLGSPEYRHFRLASSRGGVLRRNESTMQAGPAEAIADPAGKSLNELVIERWKNRVRSQGKEGLWPRIP